MSIIIPLSPEDTREVSDGFHTFRELYEHRSLLFISLCLTQTEKCVWKPHYTDWPVLFLETASGQISYHFPSYLLPLVENKIRRDDNYVWDGHSSGDVIFRLRNEAIKYTAF